MKVVCEVSKPHYHPSVDAGYTKKRDLSVPPNWVANERVNGMAVIMPPREQELYEYRQEPHIHLPEHLTVTINGKPIRVKVKVSEGYEFDPRVHIDDVDAEALTIHTGDVAEL